MEDRPLRNDRRVAGFRDLLSVSTGGGGNDLLKSGVVDMVGTTGDGWSGPDTVEPTLSRLDVVRYADCSVGRSLSEQGMLNHSSASSSVRPRDRDLDLLRAITGLRSGKKQLGWCERRIELVALTNDNLWCVNSSIVVETASS